MDTPDLKAPQQYINRELSFLEFNQRVLDLACDTGVPLLERQFWYAISVFLAIVSVVWLVLWLNGRVEGYWRRRLIGSSVGELSSLLRLARRLGDVLFEMRLRQSRRDDWTLTQLHQT